MSKLNRRGFFKSLTSAVAVLPAMGLFNFAKAEDAKKCGPAPEGKKFIKPEDKAAKRLKYVDVATTSSHKKYKAGSNCGNCRFYKKKKAAGDWAPCNMLANKYVSSCGWCQSYKAVKKA